MHKLCLLAFLLASFIVSLLVSPSVNAISSEIVISQILVGGSIGENQPTQEFISIYNNGDQEIDITNWCVSNKESIKFACFIPSEFGIKYYLPSHSYTTVSSDSFSIQNLYQPDIKYISTNLTSGSIVAGAGDNISLIDSTDQIIDSFCWNQVGDCLSISSLPGGSVWQRQIDNTAPDKLLDTNTVDDFKKINTLVISPSGLIEWVSNDICKNIDGIQNVIPDGYIVDDIGNCNPPPIDVCSNLEGIQTSLPTGYESDENGNCQSDVCLNIYGLQLFLPKDMELDGFGSCVFHDECENLLGIQAIVPEGYKKSTDGRCVLDILPIAITELLPNAVGTDMGNEFIEIYNPNSKTVDLKNYVIDIGQNYEHTYNFPDGSIIQPNQYLSFLNSEIKFTLLNSSSGARIRSIDSSFVNEIPAYNEPDSGLAWAVINNTWQYTDQPTPGSANLPSITETANVIIIADKKPCKAGQYRNEETGRCRNLTSNISNLVPCSEGQERNPATNRCRLIASGADDASLKPCGDNQERNPETNRCRKIANNMSEVKYKPEQLSTSPDNSLLYWSLASVGGVAIVYGIWEWRQELIKMIQKLLKRNK